LLLTCGQSQYNLIGNCEVNHKFKVGDLVELSDFGQTVAGDPGNEYAVIIKGPYSFGFPVDDSPEGFHIAYDIMIGDELIKRVPSIFLLRMDKDEENNDRVEKVVIRDRPD